jgi:hypothetical protein
MIYEVAPTFPIHANTNPLVEPRDAYAFLPIKRLWIFGNKNQPISKFQSSLNLVPDPG